ncbi:PAS domain S-box-containing protein/diguanylate cyclase (GGDEF) domain-containing protein [Onishia taeanensis]|uniref:PAS domain S-box-containing protein/diguanylate cyclase (GGDEF) domain-containing protein n=1 Tax=Onishia taeanensis TaxID=284577 RepID=A0A1G7P993_9GAMM|nr:GGDEF domain-containing protein [Halomonas taeanensis]SDF82848.1 PAS domain S-box-containing protein/diguanylate cyclase (GGDEF) domain-containing protein [Halomonas taeanensis]
MNSELLLDKLLDLLPDAVCAVDVEGRFVFISSACERILGYSQQELMGTPMIDLVHPDDRQRTLATAAEVMDGQLKMHFENRYIHRDGHAVDIMWTARWLEEERIRLAVARDVTAIKRAERVQQAIYRISEAVYQVDGLVELYQRIHRVIGELLPADNFQVVLFDAAKGWLTFPYYIDERLPLPASQPLTPGTPLSDVLHFGQALLITAEQAEAQGQAWIDWLGVPLISQDGVIGAVVMQSYSDVIRYTEEEKALLQFISTQVAAAISRKQTEARLEHMARHDPLTALPNRMLFNQHVDMCLKRAMRNGEPLALLYLDLNDFKDINDTLGHEAGDELLCEVARRLEKSVRDSDMVGRMGGDEFTVLLTDVADQAAVSVVADKIRAALAEPFRLGGRRLEVEMTVSIGTALYPEQGSDRQQLFRHADNAMYAIKRCLS